MTQLDRKIFTTLFFALFSTLTGVGIVVPLLPVYAHQLGAGGFGIGLIFGAFSLSRTVFLPFFGKWSDQRGRKPFIVAGLLSYALISGLFILADSIESLIAVRFVQGVASAMIMPVVQAYVGDITPEGSEGLSMGAFNMSVFFGLSAGPVLGGLIRDGFGLDTAFAAMGMMTLAGCALCAFILPPTREEQTVLHARPILPWRVLLRDPEISALFAFRFAYTSCIGVVWSFMPVLAGVTFSLSSSATGVLVMLGVFVSGALQAPMGWLADRVNRGAMVICGGLIVALSLLLFQWTGHFWHLLGVIVLFGIGGGLSMPPLMGMAVSKGSRTDAMGSVMALLTMAHSLGMLAGSLFGGWMMDIVDLRHVFSLGSVVMIAGIAGFAVLGKSYLFRALPEQTPPPRRW
jgi:DHA1 family multidrug resistance protein-like MFS transporter